MKHVLEGKRRLGLAHSFVLMLGDALGNRAYPESVGPRIPGIAHRKASHISPHGGDPHSLWSRSRSRSPSHSERGCISPASSCRLTTIQVDSPIRSAWVRYVSWRVRAGRAPGRPHQAGMRMADSGRSTKRSNSMDSATHTSQVTAANQTTDHPVAADPKRSHTTLANSTMEKCVRNSA